MSYLYIALISGFVITLIVVAATMDKDDMEDTD
jgi:hypothetical protein